MGEYTDVVHLMVVVDVVAFTVVVVGVASTVNALERVYTDKELKRKSA